MPLEKKKDGQENMLILHIEDRVYGAIVDKIDKVVGINSQTIQPPHPMFGEINIKFITGIVEKQGDLYVLLNVVKMFTQKKEDEAQKSAAVIKDEDFQPPVASAAIMSPAAEAKAGVSDKEIDFIKDSLGVLRHFYATPLNDAWLRKQFLDWSRSRGSDSQLKNVNDAEAFLGTFLSPDTGRFWSPDYASRTKEILPNLSSNNIQVWNIGCGKGYETFSFACILGSRYPNGRIKIWANDNDIMAIANAPNMTFNMNEVPEYCKAFMIEGRNGWTFNQAIKESIVFEYHDVLNVNQLPDLDIILARDTLSFFNAEGQSRMINEFEEKLKNRGVVILGKNEVLQGVWQALGKEPVSAFTHNK
jgi:purine-binding chemotaxis protein CheW